MREFLERTDTLAEKLGISLRSLAPAMGMSVASLFGYRNGSIPISSKAWRKLEQSEREAGIGTAPLDLNQPLPDGDLADKLELAASRLRVTFADIKEIGARIGRWPPPDEDLKKPPWQVLEEYRQIEASEKTSSPAPGKSA